MSMNGPNGISQTHKLKDSIIYSYLNNQVKTWVNSTLESDIIGEALICNVKKISKWINTGNVCGQNLHPITDLANFNISR